MAWGGAGKGSRGLAAKTAVADTLIRKGYAVLGMDYRANDWLTEADDVIAGYEFFRQLPYVRNDAVAMIGGSHGAKLTLEIVTRMDLPAAVYCAGFHSLSAIPKHAQGKGAKVFNTPTPSGRQRPGLQAVAELTEQLGGTPAEKPKAWAEQDLIPRLGSVNTPLLIVWPENLFASPTSMHSLSVPPPGPPSSPAGITSARERPTPTWDSKR